MSDDKPLPFQGKPFSQWAFDADNVAASMTDVQVAKLTRPGGQVTSFENFQWEDPIPISTALIPVQMFDEALLPEAFREWVIDIATRIPAPVDFAAVDAMVAAGSVIGRKVRIYPKRHDDWEVVPNLWSMKIGRPSSGKTPSQKAALTPLMRLAAEALDRHEQEKSEHDREATIVSMQTKAAKDQAQAAIKKTGDEKKARELLASVTEMPPAPTVRRYVINDGTVEKVGELLRENPNGLLQCRDELFGWLRTLDREDRSNDRAFFLESFSGDQSYVYDRIGRGTLHIPALCLSIIGGIQPGRLLPYIANAIKGGTGDDGFIQRFQFAVFPDPTAYKRTDYPPNTESRDRAYSVFRELDGIESPESQSPESVSDQFVALRFSDEAQEIFYEWLDANETRARKPDIHEAMEAHLIKYRSLVPSIALILELCDNPAVESVGKKSTVKACAWAEYLYSHAQRIYSASTNPAAANANAILQKLRVGKLPSPFRSRDISIQKWAGLTTRQAVISALDLLQEYGWIQDIVIKPVTGRPSTIYHVHPEVLGDAQESNTPKKA